MSARSVRPKPAGGDSIVAGPRLERCRDQRTALVAVLPAHRFTRAEWTKPHEQCSVKQYMHVPEWTRRLASVGSLHDSLAASLALLIQLAALAVSWSRSLIAADYEALRLDRRPIEFG